MIDFHSHILPQVDDGSQSPEETLAMLQAAYAQGVRTLVATPHFYADTMVPETFLENRAMAAKQLPLGEELPRVILGAEVAYFDNMSRSDALQRMRIGDTELLLVEMPFGSWTDRIVEDVCMLTDRQGLVPVLAHVERYRQRDQFPKYWQELLASGVLFQCNAGSFLRGSQRGWMFRQLKKGLVHFLGSDCHNMTTRPPNMGLAAQVIQKKKLAVALEEIGAFSAEILHV